MRDADAVEQLEGAAPVGGGESADLIAPAFRSPPVSTLVSTLRRGIRLNCWNTCPTSERSVRSSPRARLVTSCPATRTDPPEIGAKPVRLRMSVDLPEPDAPSSATISPGNGGDGDGGIFVGCLGIGCRSLASGESESSDTEHAQSGQGVAAHGG